MLFGTFLLCASCAGAKWDITGDAWDVTSSMWALTSSIWAVKSSMWAVASCMHATQALCGLFHPLCGLLHPLGGMSLANTGNEDIMFCGSYRAVANVPRTCLSLTNRAHVGLRFDPHWILPAMIAGNKDKERRQAMKTMNEVREPT